MNWHNVLLRPQNLYEELLRRKLISGGVPAVLQTVTDISPLALLNVARKGIKSLTQFGKCEQNGTPTPSAPINIMCNNGTIKARHHSGLPLGYQKLDYVSGRVGQTVVDTGVKGDLANLRIVFRGKKTSHTAYSPFFGNYRDENTNVTRVIEGGNASTPVLYTYNRKAGGGSASATGILSEDAHTYDLSSSGLLVDNDKLFPIRDVSGTSNSTNIAICASSVPSSAASSGASTVFAYFKIYQGDTLIRDYVPVKRLSDNKVGFYELVNNTFEQGLFASSYAFTAGSPVDDPVEIYTDGTPETLTVASETTQTASVENLFKIAANNYYADYTDEQNIISGIVTRKVGVKVLNGTEDWGYSSPVHTVKISDAVTTELRKTPLLCTHYPIIDDGRSFNDTPNNTMFFTSGKNLGIKDNTKTSEQMKAWLAQQYANGTPVVIVYPLAEATTEQVTAQHLTARDTATITAQTNNISDITLEVQYWEKAE